MASAAAVSTNISRSPLRDEEDVSEGFTGAIKEATPPAQDDDDDEDIARSRRRPAAISSMGGNAEVTRFSTEAVDPLPDVDDDAGLFGDDDDEDVLPEMGVRQLDDEELDSGDDEGRQDRATQQDNYAQEEKVDEIVQDIELGRHAIPEPSDGELYLLKVPRFLSIDQHSFQPSTWQPPTADHHSKSASVSFSAYSAALTTLRWRTSPSDPSRHQSNARILRWADGSLTLQLASTPATQYKLPAGSLAPPNPRPPKPTPLPGKSAPRRKHIGYSAELDSFTYLVAPQAQAQVLRTTNKLTTSLRIDPAGSDKTADTRAVAELQAALAKASSGGMGELGLGTVQITEDPELAKKKAEAAEKEKMRAAKRREAQEVRNRERFDRGGRRPGLGGVGGGLNAAMLEDEDDELGAGISRSRPTKPRSGAKPKKRSAASRRGEILTDDDEEFDSRRRTKEDSYDEEDGFLVNDEEEEVVDGDEEEDEEEEEEEEIDERPAKVAKPSPKRVREDVDADADGDGDVDAEGEPDDDAGDVAGARTKRRRIVDDEDEE